MMEEHRGLLSPKEQAENNLNDSSGEEEWLEGSSYSSYYSDSDSSVPEWESSINDTTGELLYIDCLPFVTQTNGDQRTKKNVELSKTQLRQSTRSKFLRLIRRRESKRRSKRLQKNHDNADATTSSNKVTFQDCQEGEEREVVISIKNENCYKLGRRGSLIESLLGLNISTLSDGNRVMIAGFMPDSEAKNEKNIKIGDWLKGINNYEVFYDNINNVLEKVKDQSEVLLKLQRVAGIEVTNVPPVNVLNNQSKFVYDLINNTTDDQYFFKLLNDNPIGVLYLDMDQFVENGNEYDAVIYCYPKFIENNVLYKSKGIYVTLNHLLHDVTKEKPKLTSFLSKDRLTHVVYVSIESNKLFLLMMPDNCFSPKELILTCDEIIHFLQFTHQSVDKCLQSEEVRNQVDSFFFRLFSRVFGERNECENKQVMFEDVLPAATFLHMPKEAQMQIDDALNDLEASDYREWNEDPLDCQRLFTILGSALYHSGYLLASHLPHCDLKDVNSYCRLQGLFHLSKTEPLRSLILWKQVFPSSCSSNLTNDDLLFPNARRYLLIVGSGKQLLAVLMEAGGCTEPPEENMGPDAFYVEEAQATLSHLQEIGLPELADHWMSTNPGSQVTVPDIPLSKRKMDFLGNFTKSISPSQNKDSLSPISKKTEVTSILKRRTPDQTLLSNAGSVYSLPEDSYDLHSEDSASQGGYSERSELSDEPVLGRRAIRERSGCYESDNENSDDDYAEGSQVSSSSYDLSELRQSLFSESEDVELLRLTAGEENVLFHYVQLDVTEGLLICPPKCKVQSQTLDLVMDNFRKCCHSIHGLFQNTLRFKNMSPQEMVKSVMNKSLIAVKEHGICFECPFQDDRVKKNYKVNFWVVGRLFFMPHPREIYVCYEDTVPQNITEIAFRLGLSMTV